MNHAPLLAARFREVFLNGTWIANTNYRQELEGLDWRVATHQVGSRNTIAVLAQHIHYYVDGILNVFRGGKLEISDKFSFDFEPISSQQQWGDFLQRFFTNAEAFALAVEQLDNTKLAHDFEDARYGSYLRNMDGMMEHAYYHLGQIVLLKKIILE